MSQQFQWLAGAPMVGEKDGDPKRRDPKAQEGDGTGGKKPPRPQEFAPSGGPGDDPLTRNLKKVYAQVAAEPVPDRLLRLLDQLDAKAKKDGQNG
jgi:hypothetical protein